MSLSRLFIAAFSVCLLATSTAFAGTVTLKNGDEIQGTVTAQGDEGVTLDHATLGTLELDSAQVKGVALDKDDPIYVPQTPTGWFFPGWEKSLGAGFNGSDGNSETLNIYAGFDTGYEDEYDRWAIKAKYFLATDEGDQTRNEGSIGVTKDWLMPDEKYFYYARAEFEYDRFTGWDSRTSGFAGIGYNLVDENGVSLIGRVGLGGNYEAGDVNEFTPEGMLGLEYLWKIKKDHTFSVYNYMYPSLDPAFSDYRNTTGAEYKIKLDTARGLSLKLGIENEYISDPTPGTESNDLKYFGALVYDF